jgi:Sulfotransferase domain
VTRLSRRRLAKLARHPIRTVRPLQSSLAVAAGFKRRFVRPSGPYVFVACMPRSGSTFLTETLAELTGFKRVELTDAYVENEQELDVPRLLDAYSYGTVTQQHVCANARTVALMREYGIRPVVLVRNVFDVVVSIRHFLLTEGCGKWPTFFTTDERFRRLDETAQYEQIVELGLPWYFDFFVSWAGVAREDALDTLWLTYEEVVPDWHSAISRIAVFYGLRADASAIDDALRRTTSRAPELRLNKGRPGFGATTLDPALRERIARYARFYPDVDFTPIGLGPDAAA